MQAPLFVRPPTDAERRALEAGLRSPAAFTLRRCQIVLASARDEHTPVIAAALGCSQQGLRAALIGPAPRLPVPTGEAPFDARIYALASGKSADKKREHADRAMELLRKAVKAGFNDAGHMKKDTDLNPLRGREDFKKLLGELEQKAKPKVKARD